MALEACLWSRTATRVLWLVGTFEAHNQDDLYEGIRAIDWSAHLVPTATLAVFAESRDNPNLHHTKFVALKVKDAIVDQIRDRTGSRPSVDPDAPDLQVLVRVSGTETQVFVDLAGEPLHRRGYRVAMTEAPLKESLAAGVIALGQVAPDRPFVDPMAGSGTLAIEHVLAARKVAPGLGRRFGVERWPTRRTEIEGLMRDLRERAAAEKTTTSLPPVIVRDVDPEAIEAARRNAAAAGVAADLRFEVADVATLDLGRVGPGVPGTVVANPPYGERLRPDDLRRSYLALVQAFRRAEDWALVVLSGSPLWSDATLARPRIDHKLWNGPLPVRLLRYD